MVRNTAKLGGTASDIVVAKVAVSRMLFDVILATSLTFPFSYVLSMD